VCSRLLTGFDNDLGDGKIVKAATLAEVRDEHRRLFRHDGEGDPKAAERSTWRRAHGLAVPDYVCQDASGALDFVWKK
jgi:hypothetical protein